MKLNMNIFYILCTLHETIQRLASNGSITSRRWEEKNTRKREINLTSNQSPFVGGGRETYDRVRLAQRLIKAPLVGDGGGTHDRERLASNQSPSPKWEGKTHDRERD